MGHSIPTQAPQTLATLANADAVSISQDALGIQAQRVATAVAAPSDGSPAPGFPTVVLARCDDRSSQRWSIGPAGELSTIHPAAGKVCLSDAYPGEGGLVAEPCDSSFVPTDAHRGLASRVAFNNQVGASGPVPHTRWAFLSTNGAPSPLTISSNNDGATPLQSTHTIRVAAGTAAVLDDDCVGGVTTLPAEDFCLDVVNAGQLETWAGPLSNGRFAVGLFNRSPAAAPISASWTSFNASATATFDIKDVWSGKDLGSFTGSYTTTVQPQGVAYLILTPA
jgi:hypothetical protein